MDPDVAAHQRRADFERIARDVTEPVRRFLARRTDPTTAEDVLADVLLVLWRRLDGAPSEVLPWAYGVARNCLANAERSARRQQRVAAKIAVVDPPGETEAVAAEPDERVLAALASLRPAEAELLNLWAWEGLGPAEIAKVLDITANAAAIRLHRAREKFKDALRKTSAAAGHERSNERRTP